MKKTIILHIGLPKTGTTYLQCQIQTNRDKLSSKGIYVPKAGQLVGRDHNLLALAMQPERWDQFPTDICASLPSLWDRFLEEIDNCGCPTILVTSEAFSWELKTADQIKSIRDYLVNYNVKIVFCERNPYDFISSMYSQLIRTGRGPYQLDSFLLEFPYFWSVDFQKERWGEHFGINNFIILSYDELRGEFILYKFLNTVFPGHAILSESFDSSLDVNPNLSYSPRFLRFLEELSANNIDSTPYINLYSKLLNTIVPLERQIVTPLEIDEAMKRCGMVSGYCKSTSIKMLQQREKQEKDLLLEKISNELKDRTQELIDTRQLLRDRTDMLEKQIAESASQIKTVSKTAHGFRKFFKDKITYFAELFSSRKRLLEELGEIKRLLEKNFNLTSLAEERSKTNFNLTSLAEERSRTLEYVLNQNLFTEQHQLDQLHKFYVEWMTTVVDLNQKAAFNASSILELQTDYPVAIESYDHISPGSTTEGVSRPTLFVKNCISILGKDIKCLDLGTGAAGLIYEYAMSGVLAVGIDGSDFCRINEIGYWPLLPNNLFNCDITKPFSFLSRDTKTQIGFDVITMWEVLEHIAESDLPNLFSNINRHLVQHGYFIGSISFIEYMDSVGNKYHVTLKPRNWWKEKFFEGGLTMLDTHPFNEKFFCRGNGPRFQDIHNYELNPREGFLFVAQKFCDNSGISA